MKLGPNQVSSTADSCSFPQPLHWNILEPMSAVSMLSAGRAENPSFTHLYVVSMAKIVCDSLGPTTDPPALTDSEKP